MKAHAQPGNFSCWFWNAIQAATGFTPEVVDEVKHSHHVSYEIPERRLDEVTWTDQVAPLVPYPIPPGPAPWSPVITRPGGRGIRVRRVR